MRGRGEPGLEGEPGEPGVDGGGEGGHGGAGGSGGSAYTTGWRRLVFQLSFALLVVVIPITAGFLWIDARSANKRADSRETIQKLFRADAERRDEISCRQRLVIIENQRLLLQASLYVSVTRTPLLPELPTEPQLRTSLEKLKTVADRGC